MGNVKYTIVGNADDAQKAVDKLRAQFEKLEGKLRDQAKYSRQAKTAGNDYANSQVAALKNMVLGIVSVQSAWNVARAALKAYIDDNKKVQDGRSKVASSARETEIKLINQGQLNANETATTMQNIDAASQAIPVGTVHDSKRITEEMFSQGFDRQEVINGETLKAFLELKAATNQFGEGAIDSKELVKSIATSLRNTEGRDPRKAISAQEIEQFGRAFQSLFLTQSIQLQDAIPFARIQSILTARGIDEKTQLAAFSVAVDAFGGGEVAATYLQQATAYMGRAGSEKMKAKLDKLGIEIDGTKFDLVGEDLVQALRNMDQAIGALDPRAKADALDALFGTKAQAGALTLMSKAGNIEESRRKISSANGQTYDEAVAKFRLSDQARSAGIANNAEVAQVGGLKSQNNLTFEDVDQILSATFEKIKQEGGNSFPLSMGIRDAGITKWMRGEDMKPQEYLDLIQKRMNEGIWGGGRAGELLNRQIDKADPSTKQMEVIRDAIRNVNQAGEMTLKPRAEMPAPVRDRANDLTPAELGFKNALDAVDRERSEANINKYLEAKKALQKQLPEGVDFSEQTRNIYRRANNRKLELDGIGNANSSETMNVKDADLQASVKELNTTMSRVAEVLEQGPDRQRVLRVPRGTA